MQLIETAGAPGPALAALGDIGVIGTARARARREGYDALLRVPSQALRAADLAFANLEFPVGEPAWVRPGRSSEFRHDEDVCAALARAGVRVVSLANNHMMDCGPRGLERTLGACERAGLLTAGAGADLAAARMPVRLEVAGRRVVLLAYAQTSGDAAGAGVPGVAPLDEAIVREDVTRWRAEADVLIVSAHWGSMYVDYPPPRVTAMARALAEAGADVVLGHHPHVLQGAGTVGSTLVLYSLGDAAFNCRAGDFHARVAAQSRLASGTFTVRIASARHGLDLSPHRLDDDGFPVAADAAQAAAIAERVRTLGAGLADAAGNFAAEAAPRLLQYELEGIGHYLRQGRIDRIAKLLLSIRPRHLRLLWQGVSRRGGGG